MLTLNDKNIGDIVTIKENGAAVNYIIVHKGLPSGMYDSSCDGVWLLRNSSVGSGNWGDSHKNDYENSEINAWLNDSSESGFLKRYAPGIVAAIKQVKIPFKKGTGDALTGVQSGTNGLSCKVFLLSGFEVGGIQEYDDDDDEKLPVDGAKLSYFTSASKRALPTKNSWWLRTPELKNAGLAQVVAWPDWYLGRQTVSTYYNLRPAFILPYNILVDSDGTVSTNIHPAITSDKSGALGELTDGFTCNYSVNDADEADLVTVTLTLDGAQVDKFTAEKGKPYTYSITGDEWLKIANGSHTFKIIAADGKDTAESTAAFSRIVNGAFISLETPLDADDTIRACSLYIKGSLPADTDLLCEVTNNGNDAEPVWEDCTVKVKEGLPYLFQNKTAENGSAFNFRVSAKRGASGAGGYITEISGGFE